MGFANRNRVVLVVQSSLVDEPSRRCNVAGVSLTEGVRKYCFGVVVGDGKGDK